MKINVEHVILGIILLYTALSSQRILKKMEELNLTIDEVSEKVSEFIGLSSESLDALKASVEELNTTVADLTRRLEEADENADVSEELAKLRAIASSLDEAIANVN